MLVNIALVAILRLISAVIVFMMLVSFGVV